jgi:hypothetical protein
MFALGLVLGLALFQTPHYAERDTSNPAVKDFTDRVGRYWDLHKKVDGNAPPADKKKEPDPALIIEHERAVSAGIRAARANAAEGDMFTPAVQKVLIGTINRQLSSGPGAKIRREMILGEGNPKNAESPARVDLVVNGKYPPNAPLSTVPPSVLLSLPKLPQGMEYRFVGRHLILFDSKANLIVDVLRNAIR